jgi:DNA-binding NarL/FixJ family response regulator
MKYKILFIDDDTNLLDGLRRSLHAQESVWEMSFAASAEEALSMCGTRRFDVVISDYKMPGMDGLSLLRKIAEKNPNTKTILLSGQTDETTFERGRESVDAYLAKPCTAPLIIGEINKLIGGGSQ